MSKPMSQLSDSANSPTAAVVLIGNEILSGRTQDKNLTYLAKELNKIGVKVAESRVIPDVHKTIIDTVNELRAKYTYVFTTGGIGPTHDDITAEAVAKALGVSLPVNPEAYRRLEAHYASSEQEFNEARQKMAYIPEGAELIDNPVSVAPGFYLENVYVLAGVPRICEAMIDSVKHTLNGGAPTLSRSFAFNCTEGDIAASISQLQQDFDDIEIGSYPHIKHGKLGVSIVLRSQDADRLNNASEALKGISADVIEEVTEE